MKKIISVLLVLILSAVCVITAFAGNFDLQNLGGSSIALGAKSAIIIDQDTGKALWRKSSKTRMNPASTTKIMTALLAVEYGNMKDTITVGPELDFIESDSSKADLVRGERISLQNLLKGLMLPSGGDAAYVVAVYTARKASKNTKMTEREAVDYFCELMNKRAVKAGAKDTHFANPDGYQNEEHYTTASDLALIARAAMKYKQFKSIVALPSFNIKEWKSTSKSTKNKNGIRKWENTNKLLDKNGSYYYKYCTGIKTGYTSDAGYCLVSSASKGGKNIIAVVLNSTTKDVWTDSTKLLDYGLSK